MLSCIVASYKPLKDITVLGGISQIPWIIVLGKDVLGLDFVMCINLEHFVTMSFSNFVLFLFQNIRTEGLLGNIYS